jgi:hypothetical protein
MRHGAENDAPFHVLSPAERQVERSVILVEHTIPIALFKNPGHSAKIAFSEPQVGRFKTVFRHAAELLNQKSGHPLQHRLTRARPPISMGAPG